MSVICITTGVIYMNIMWFRRDLRLEDNAALHAALSAGEVLPVFIFDTDILSQLQDRDDRRVSYIYQQVVLLKQQLEEAGSSLEICIGSPLAVFARLLGEYQVERVFAGRDYEPDAISRDRQVADLLEQHDAGLELVKDHVIFDAGEILKADGNPYIVYTPYMRAWKRRYHELPPITLDSENRLDKLLRREPAYCPAMDEIGFIKVDDPVPPVALDPDVLRHYDRLRDFPASDATSRAGPYLRFGTISIRSLVGMAMDINETYLNQLIWRDFFIQVLAHFPHSATASFRRHYDAIPWRNDTSEFRLWCEGKTGFPIVDAGMRQLNRTGYMHNRVRMISANFLTKLLLVDWRWGEAWFARKLLDYEMANNIGGWQWASGSGCDAAPYFRIFNPDTQTKRFDPELEYIRQWIPEFDSGDYPSPMIDYRNARVRALDVYKSALQTARAGTS